ncbi:tRNA uridine-5-carboxymethylaminomethyl(34) synthesis GTPase MnmE [Hyphobacterium sp. HN65]|uniref:tRNA modification GTPase MnmE n=1 Tax=Hyphobacterium lacteum TaxID=3116575 RepID=A0ABU7LSJ5_9PROT|nr:tRNA uridine-5-carboxymethylaminomethyl(34) synthesis GTPase MnmE [Hyphobacterium sp. HN65]MEE2526621.1 tRNA uridine-5-carboxymethylaminomethyl(34) synthesis GTPase MnmE [Hyphobacterium sp. HN65]
MAGDTIFALATPPGRSGVAVLRLSGPDSGNIVSAAIQRALPSPRQAALRKILAEDGRLLDEGLILWFPGPASFTGEDSAELQIHGGTAVIEGVSARLSELGARLAEPGEFTRRAYENGRIDLTQAEGLADLVDAETSAQREQALSQMTGALRDLYEGWRRQLISIMAAIEGEIDFPDEEGVPEALAATALPVIDELINALGAHLDDDHRGERVREGFRIAIIGPPNAGKSSLLNALAGREAAIVTDIPGTTRDVVEIRLELGGFVVTLADTAGLRDTDDVVEKEGVRRALTHADSADFVVGLLDGSGDWNQEMTPVLQKSDFLVFAKADLGLSLTLPDSIGPDLVISTQSGQGLGDLEARLKAVVSERLGQREMPALSRLRHRLSVSGARDALQRARLRFGDPELAGEDIRLAVRALESLTGRIDVEDVLDEVFSRFCIGK